MPLIAAIYCFFIGLFLVLLSFIFQLSPGWKELFLIVTVLSYGFVISAPPLFTPFPDKIYRIDGRCNEILPHHNLILSVSNQNYYLSHFYTDTIYMPGDSLHFNARILPFRQNANPGEFSYARYLKQKNVFFHLLPVSPIRQNGHSDDLYTVFDHLRKKWLSKTHRLFSDSTCCQLVNALCLGYKNDLDSEVQNLFISTGTVHLLSVSGLHTGAIYLFILFIFKSIGFPSRKITFVVLPILWCYVCLTGLSPSVVRAATILSFIHIGQYFNRSYTPLNSVAAAAFLTLSFHPSNLYSLSFLLSYSAYTGILTIYPFLYRFAGKLPPFPAKIYACCCITVAAQLPTLPISAYYFHTINLNGFLANLVAVPLATFLLYAAMLCLLLPFLLSQYLAWIPEVTEKIIMGFLHIFAPYSFNLHHLYPSVPTVLLSYISLIFLYLYFTKPGKKWRRYSMFTLFILLCWHISSHFYLANRQEIIVFQLPQKSAIILNYKGYYTYLLRSSDSLPQTQPYIAQNNLRSLPDHQGFLGNGLSYHSGQLCSLKDTLTIASASNLPLTKGQILIVTHNLSPEKIFSPEEHRYPAQIVLDGSNTAFNIRLWDKFCRQHHLTLINTAETGSFRYSLR